jgi:hypothetical protein
VIPARFWSSSSPIRPPWFDKLDGLADETSGQRIFWFSLRDLAEAIDKLITDPARVVAEQTRFLLAELVALYEADGLLSADDTVVVAGRSAWPEHQRLAAYVCQSNRSFRAGLKYVGFCAEGAIQQLIAHIRNHYTAVLFTRDEASALRAHSDVELATSSRVSWTGRQNRRRSVRRLAPDQSRRSQDYPPSGTYHQRQGHRVR